ncbi:MAG: hypothetical protein IT537_15805 [Hyphomicrobiales bacterium]|nr:hypothetical protein [Hyphomicrobiales bacterium]
MSDCPRDLILADALSDPVIQAVMAADNVDPGEVEALMQRILRRRGTAPAAHASGSLAELSA